MMENVYDAVMESVFVNSFDNLNLAFPEGGYHHIKFGLVWIDGNKVTRRGKQITLSSLRMY